MLIACDGGAFQVGASSGIRGCSIGFLNAAAQIDQSLRAVLVADPRLGEIPPEMVDRLLLKPEIVYAQVAPGCEPPLRGGQQREDSRQRKDAEMAVRWDPNAAALGHLEVVADGQPANRAPLNPLNGDAQVEQRKPAHVRPHLMGNFLLFVG